MIARIEGYLESVEGGIALLQMPVGTAAGMTADLRSGPAQPCGFTYEVLLPAFAAARLSRSVGTVIALHTLHYMEGQNQGATMLPRLVGFLNVEDRRFYELFTTCKGIGYRKALRAMTLSTDVIATAIADRDLDLLQSLPEIGRRTAETIVATLRGKVDRFVTAAAFPAQGGGGGQSTDNGDTPGAGKSNIAAETLKVLLQLGETRADAVRWIDQALAEAADQKARPQSAEELLAAVYRIKAL